MEHRRREHAIGPSLWKEGRETHSQEGRMAHWFLQVPRGKHVLRMGSGSSERWASVEDSETQRRHDVTSSKLCHRKFVHTQGNLSQGSGHMDPSPVSEIGRRLGQHRGHHNVARKEKERTVPQPTQHRPCATLKQHGKHIEE